MAGKGMTVDLGKELKNVRLSGGLSLAAVAGPAKISPTYLQKLEAGVVNNPSPRVLQRLAGVLGISYLKLMELAGYLAEAPGKSGRSGRGGRAGRESILQGLSEEERRAVAAFVRYLKAQRTGGIPPSANRHR